MEKLLVKWVPGQQMIIHNPYTVWYRYNTVNFLKNLTIDTP